MHVIFCGAGTSAFIGDTLVAWLRGRFESSNPVTFESVSTTNLVANPAQYLKVDRPIIMVSFARSGNSPESLAAIELANSRLRECYHLVCTCNEKGRLALEVGSLPDTYKLSLPACTHDQGFAMTSSYTAMLVATAEVFFPNEGQLEVVANLAEELINLRVSEISTLAHMKFDRLVVLGAGLLEGTAREFALKCLELAGGGLVATSDTPLGFRHGPKIMVTANTVVVHLQSNDSYTQLYDRDLHASGTKGANDSSHTGCDQDILKSVWQWRH